ncbi:Photosystem II 22 kDa protein, chloroplastic [Canna indica]|uniref:Photosystem II 22 kDa protein, chloroplastic n=1 Tax=Canna indica TaxID=4628 RepID=A0AAQ3JU79_9LILI|nr:Photosystem II 22 kDa protein, chloroplastic [Canna indica]
MEREKTCQRKWRVVESDVNDSPQAMMAQSMLVSSINGGGRDSTALLRRLRASPTSTSFAPTLAILKSRTKAAPTKKGEKPKTKVEDGIFGTSGGIGFTKENELFVGRVAMLGFAVFQFTKLIEPLLLFFILFTLLGAIGALGDRGQFVDDPPTGLEKAVIPPGKGFRSALGLNEGGPLFGFTKANELFVGRMAQLGIAFSIIGEIITGKGALAQLNIETGVPITEIEPLVLFSVLFFFVAAVNPGTGKFVITDEDEE